MRDKFLLILFFGIILSVSACKKKSHFTEEKQESFNLKKLTVYVLKNKYDIFEMAEFRLAYDTVTWAPLYELNKHFDSLHFKQVGGKKEMLVFKPHQATTSWGHHFYYPGTYKMYLVGYKNNQVTFTGDTVVVDVVNNSDFLKFDWEQADSLIRNHIMENNLIINRGYHQVFATNTVAMYPKYQKGNIPSWVVNNYWNHQGNWDDDFIADKNIEYFYDFMLKIYGEPQYSFMKDANLSHVYSETFTQPLGSNDKVYYIWYTSKSKISLKKMIQNEKMVNVIIYAEPL